MCEDRLAEEDAAWTRSWREEILSKGWAELSRVEQSTGTPYYSVLRFRSEQPDLRSEDIAAQLSGKVKKTLNSSSVRVLIHRARELLAEQMLDLVLESIDNPIAGRLRTGVDRIEPVEVLPPGAQAAARRAGGSAE